MICKNRFIFVRMILLYNNIPKRMYMYDFIIYINKLAGIDSMSKREVTK